MIRSKTVSKPILAAPEKLKVVEAVKETAREAATPLQLWERTLEHPIALLVLPLFALANAGVSVELSAMPGLVREPLMLGVTLGMVLGKTLGVCLAAFAVTRYGAGTPPEGIRLRHLPGLGLLAGVGFTMSIFIASLGFSGDRELLELAKISILSASLIAGALGYGALRIAARNGSAG